MRGEPYLAFSISTKQYPSSCLVASQYLRPVSLLLCCVCVAFRLVLATCFTYCCVIRLLFLLSCYSYCYCFVIVIVLSLFLSLLLCCHCSCHCYCVVIVFVIVIVLLLLFLIAIILDNIYIVRNHFGSASFTSFICVGSCAGTPQSL